MTNHEKWLKERHGISDSKISKAGVFAKNVQTGWFGLFKLSNHQTNRLNIFNF